MPGDEWQRFANLRAYYGFMFGHPGKKLLFMGSEFGQENEWRHDHSLDWHLTEQPQHAGIQTLIRDLNRLYSSLPALHALDCEAAGFEWLVMHDAERGVFAWLRKGRQTRDTSLLLSNFPPEFYRDYQTKVPSSAPWREVLNTDSALYGGGNVGTGGAVTRWTQARFPRSALLFRPLLQFFS